MKQTVFKNRKKPPFDVMADYMESAIFRASDISEYVEQDDCAIECGNCQYRLICGGIHPYNENFKCENVKNKAVELLDAALEYLDLSTEAIGGTNVIH